MTDIRMTVKAQKFWKNNQNAYFMPPAHMRWCVLSDVSGSRRGEKAVNSAGREPAPAIWPILRSRQAAPAFMTLAIRIRAKEAK